MKETKMTTNTMKPVIVDGQVIPDYFVCRNGDIWSTKRGDYLRKLSVKVSGDPSKSLCPYPKVAISINGKSHKKLAHRVVCETLHKFPVPFGVTKSEWKQTPDSVKALLRGGYQVNHIDHDVKNYHPSNLEWVTVKQNAQKREEHRVLNRR
jgi:hypothetical protein